MLWNDWVQRFSYDAVGNRTDQSGTYATGNRLQVFAGCSYETDFDGNVTHRTCPADTITFTWTAENRLASYTVGSTTVAFHYDAGGRLVRKDVNGSSAPFLWDGAELLAELTGAATGKVGEYAYLGLDRPHALIVGATAYYAHLDGLGNVIALTDSTSGTTALKRTYGYGAWGGPTGRVDQDGPARGETRSRQHCGACERVLYSPL